MNFEELTEGQLRIVSIMVVSAFGIGTVFGWAATSVIVLVLAILMGTPG